MTLAILLVANGMDPAGNHSIGASQAPAADLGNPVVGAGLPANPVASAAAVSPAPGPKQAEKVASPDVPVLAKSRAVPEVRSAPTAGQTTRPFASTPPPVPPAVRHGLDLEAQTSRASVAHRNNGQSMFAYGDSITAGWTPDNQRPDGHADYLMALRNAYYPDRSAGMNIDGSGRGTAWALDHLGTYLPPAGLSNDVFFLEFGVNDHRPDAHVASSQQSAANQAALYRAVKERAATVYWLSPLVVDPACETPAPADQMNWIEAARQEALRNDATWIPIYDALDVAPLNGQFDGFVRGNNMDCVHPTLQGHRLIADLLHLFVDHLDHQVTPDGQNDLLDLQANYTQTVVVPLDPSWDRTGCEAWDATVGAPAPADVGAGQTLQVHAIAGHSYLVGPGAVAEGMARAPDTQRRPGFPSPGHDPQGPFVPSPESLLG